MTSDTSFQSEDGAIRVEVTDEGPTAKLLSVEIDPVRVDKAFDRAYQGLRREVRVKGFRPGKTPRGVLERLYGASIIEEIERVLVSETLPDALELSDVHPIIEPDIDADKPAPNAAFTYRARLEVKPEIELPDLADLPAKRPAVRVGDDEVLRQVETLRERTAPIVEQPEGTVAEDGHTLTIDFVGRVDGESFEGGSAKGHEIELGSGRFVSGFEEQLVGMTVGEDRRVQIEFPEDYANAELAGKEAVFEVHVDAIKKRELPELDDEFAKDMGDFETLDELRDRIRSDFKTERDLAADAMLRRTVMDSLIARTDFEVPAGIVERQVQHQITSFQREYEGQVPADVLQSQLGRMAEDGRPAAERRVRESFLLAAVAQAKRLEASDADVDARLDEIAEERQMPPAQLRKLAREQGWHDAIRSDLVDRKALAVLTEEADIEEIEPEEDWA